MFEIKIDAIKKLINLKYLKKKIIQMIYLLIIREFNDISDYDDKNDNNEIFFFSIRKSLFFITIILINLLMIYDYFSPLVI